LAGVTGGQKKPVQEKYYSLKDDDDTELERAIAASLGGMSERRERRVDGMREMLCLVWL
jgi:hypothetical protein